MAKKQKAQTYQIMVCGLYICPSPWTIPFTKTSMLQAQSYTSTPSMHSHSCNFSVPLYHDRQPRGYDHDSHGGTALSTMPGEDLTTV